MATFIKGNAVANATRYELLEKSAEGEYKSLAEASEINFDISALASTSVVGKNKYNKDASGAADQYFYTAEGVYKAGTAWACTGKAAVEPETDYVFSTDANIVNVVYLSGEAGDTFMERADYTSGYFTTPAGCTFVAFNLFGKGHTEDEFNSAIASAQLEMGQAATDYEAYTGGTMLETGDHILVVKAHADGYESSDYSNEVTYTVA